VNKTPDSPEALLEPFNSFVKRRSLMKRTIKTVEQDDCPDSFAAKRVKHYPSDTKAMLLAMEDAGITGDYEYQEKDDIEKIMPNYF
jgi:hypothetical protein